MKKIEITKLSKVNAPANELPGVVAFQLIEYVIDYFGNKIMGQLDTKILQDGRQVVIDGDGYIPAGYEI